MWVSARGGWFALPTPVFTGIMEKYDPIPGSLASQGHVADEVRAANPVCSEAADCLEDLCVIQEPDFCCSKLLWVIGVLPGQNQACERV